MAEPYAVLFPGQGAQYVGMGEKLIEEYPEARSVFERASDALGWDVARLCIEGPADRLNLTEYTQPALLTLSVAVWETLKKYEIPQPAVAAGLSLGEYSALVAAGVLSLEDACVLVHKRGKYMQRAVPPGDGAMAAVLGLDGDVVREVCGELREENPGGVIQGANFNCPGQVVISGHTPLVQEACDRLSERGARRAVPLEVSAPFHCSLMTPARDELAAALWDATFCTARFPVIANVTAREVVEPDEIREALLEQVASAVLWEASMARILRGGVKRFVEAGPGSVLRGFLRRIDPKAEALGCEKPEDVEGVLGTL